MESKKYRNKIRTTGTREAVESSIAISKDDKTSTWERLAMRNVISRWPDERIYPSKNKEHAKCSGKSNDE